MLRLGVTQYSMRYSNSLILNELEYLASRSGIPYLTIGGRGLSGTGYLTYISGSPIRARCVEDAPYEFYFIISRLSAITAIPATSPRMLSCPLPYARLVGRSSSRLM